MKSLAEAKPGGTVRLKMGGEWVFRGDDDGHWYWIPLWMDGIFTSLLEASQEADDYSSFEAEFGHMRCSHPSCYVFDDKRVK